MTGPGLLFAILALLAVVGLGWWVVRRRRREQLRASPIPEGWRSLLEVRVPLYRRLPALMRKRLHGHIHVFLAEKQFVGCNGLQITEEMKWIVAAQACLLILNRKDWCFPDLYSILIYPGAYRVRVEEPIGGYVVSESNEVRAGESWSRGEVVFSWEDVVRDTMAPDHGSNVVLHEFTHQLDQEDGSVDGVPVLKRSSGYDGWAKIFRREYKQLRLALRQRRATVIDPYGATNPAEFFAVSTETFYCIPEQMQQEHPELYGVLQEYYGVDPATWL